MRETTDRWLTPILEQAAATLGAAGVNRLLLETRMPAAEADDRTGAAMRLLDVPAESAFAIDWVRFGNLLQAELGLEETWPEE